MAGSVNKVILVGNLGRDPESRAFQNGGKVVSFSLATSESWNDKASGERKDKTQWHRVVIYNEKLGEIAEKYCKKGNKVYLEGSLETRKFTDQGGAEREITEVVIQRFRGELTMLEGRAAGGEMGEPSDSGGYQARQPARAAPARSGASSAAPSWEPSKGSDLDDDIPF